MYGYTWMMSLQEPACCLFQRYDAGWQASQKTKTWTFGAKNDESVSWSPETREQKEEGKRREKPYW